MPKVMCDFCKTRPARCRITEVDNGQLKQFFACRECANMQQAAGLLNIPLDEAAAKVTSSTPSETPQAAQQTTRPARETCPHCGLSFAAFRESGRFGCGLCYPSFREQIPQVMQQVQAGARHVGKVPNRVKSMDAIERRINELRTRIAQAVQEEDFATAAQLRDEARGLENEREALMTVPPPSTGTEEDAHDSP